MVAQNRKLQNGNPKEAKKLLGKNGEMDLLKQFMKMQNLKQTYN